VTSKRRAFPRLAPLWLLSALAVLAAALAAAAGAASTSGASARRLATPKLGRIAQGPASIADTTVAKAPARAAYWGGPTTATDGEAVTIFVSDSYPQDPALALRWADFFTKLVHGPELAKLTAYLAPLDEVQTFCGADALACYDPRTESLVAPGDAPASDISAEAVVTHEYGHHVAENRSNAPWVAEDYGPKRWASAMQVCARTQTGQLFPGAESVPRYQLNPGEGFAEAYRVLNERLQGLPETPWDIVSTSLYPSAAALAALQQDVAAPWTGPTTTSTKAALSARVTSRTTRVATSLDGTFRATLTAPARSRFALELLTSSGRRLARSVTTVGSRVRSVTTTICGQRGLRLRVSRVSGAGTYSLAVAHP
jgi:hypothetical protein